jgi:molybdate transport system ATP-binding protein
MSGLAIDIRVPLGDFLLQVAFTAPEKGVTALFGPSGSGKTSLLRSIAGLNRNCRGLIRINEQVWQDERRFLATHKRPLGYVFQEASLFAHLSVRGNLEYGWRRVPAAQRRMNFDHLVELMAIGPLLQRASHRLSGGERQRVAIARALLGNPRLLLMDEPLSALDHAARQTIFPCLQKVQEAFAIPSLYVSHDPNEVARLADHMIYLQQGAVIAQGPATDLMTRLDLPISTLDSATAILKGQVESHDAPFHLSWIGMADGRIAVSRQALAIGCQARVEIQAKDVSLSRSAHTDTSILNILSARVMETREVSASQLIIKLRLNDGQILLSRITRRSASTLQIRPGLQLYAQVKSVALLI